MFGRHRRAARPVDLKQLTAVVTVADVGSVTRAARLLGVVQPAVTRQVRALEEEIGVPLFDRTRHGMIPTTAGEMLIDRARRALNELERARAELGTDPEAVAGIVTVGVLESATDAVAEPLVRAVAERHPRIQLRILTAYSGHLREWLDSGALDLSLLYDLADTPSLAATPLLRERLWAVAPADAGLTPATPLPWAALLEVPMVLPVPGHGLRSLVDQARSPTDTKLQISVETNSMQVQKQLVLAGRGWTVLPASGVAREVAAGLLSGAPLTEPDVSRSVVLTLQRVRRTPRPVQAVADVLADLVRRLVRAGGWPSADLEHEPAISGEAVR